MVARRIVLVSSVILLQFNLACPRPFRVQRPTLPSRLPNQPSSMRALETKRLGPSKESFNQHLPWRRGTSLSDSQRLLQHLMTDYWKETMPASPPEMPLVVTLRLFAIKVLNLYDKNEVLEMTVRIQIGWRDSMFEWSPAEFGNMTSFVIAHNRLWVPDLQIANSATDLHGLLGDDKFSFKLHNDGSVWWHPTGNVLTRCELNLKFFPFDTQHCPIIIESAISTVDVVNLTLRPNKPPVSLVMYIESSNWQLLDVEGEEDTLWVSPTTGLGRVAFWLRFGRKTSYFKLNVIAPCAMLSSLQLLTFLFPTESTERIPQATSILLSVIVFQTMIVDQLPRSSDVLPLLCIYIGLLTSVSVVSVAESVLIAGLVARKHFRTEAPLWSHSFLKLIYRWSPYWHTSAELVERTKKAVHKDPSKNSISRPAQTPVRKGNSILSVTYKRASRRRPLKESITEEIRRNAVGPMSGPDGSLPTELSSGSHGCVSVAETNIFDRLPLGKKLETARRRRATLFRSEDGDILLDWLCLAHLIDAVTFVAVFVVITIIPIIFFAVLPPDQ